MEHTIELLQFVLVYQLKEVFFFNLQYKISLETVNYYQLNFFLQRVK